MPRTLFGNNPNGTLIGYRSQDFLDSPDFLYHSRSTACSHFHTPQKQFSACTKCGCVASLCLFPQPQNGQRAEKLISL